MTTTTHTPHQRIIDGDGWRTSNFDLEVIRTARQMGADFSNEDWEIIRAAERDEWSMVSDLTPEQCSALSELANEAVEFMNAETDEGTYFYIEDQSLWGVYAK